MRGEDAWGALQVGRGLDLDEAGGGQEGFDGRRLAIADFICDESAENERGVSGGFVA